MAATIDLHMHTTYSDGTAEPEALLRAVAAQGVTMLSVTDHDTTAGYSLLKPEAEVLGITLIPGIEINTHWKGAEVHVLGYFIDFEDSDLQELILQHRQQRLVQITAMVQKLQKLTNYPLSVDAVLEQSRPGGSLGRPHLARALIASKAVTTLSEAFTKYLKSNCATYVQRETCSPHEAVEVIHGAGGIPVIAHPGLAEGIEQLVPELLTYGLMGLEAYHKGHSPAVIEFISSLAEKHDLLMTGGTDFHGVGEAYRYAHQRLLMPNFIQQQLLKKQEAKTLRKFKVS